MKSAGRFRSIVLSFLSGLLLGECVTAPNVEADRNVTAQIKKIALKRKEGRISRRKPEIRPALADPSEMQHALRTESG
jgi:hypothetical protein